MEFQKQLKFHWLPSRAGKRSFFLTPPSEGKVSNYLKYIKNNKVTGLSSIPNKILKQFGNTLSLP